MEKTAQQASLVPPSFLARLVRSLSFLRPLRGYQRLVYTLFPVDRRPAFVVDVVESGTRFSGSNADYIFHYTYFVGAYEHEKLRALAAAARDPEHSTVLDIGANHGTSLAQLAKLFGAVHAFEPNARLHGDIARHIELNGLENVTLHPVGLGLSDEAATLIVFNGSNSGTASFLENETFLPNGYRIESMIKHGDSLIGSLPPMRISAIKMDVQGFEINVIQGLAETIRSNRPALLIEVADKDVQSRLAGDAELDFIFEGASIYGFRPEGLVRRKLTQFRMSRPEIGTYEGDILVVSDKFGLAA